MNSQTLKCPGGSTVLPCSFHIAQTVKISIKQKPVMDAPGHFAEVEEFEVNSQNGDILSHSDELGLPLAGLSTALLCCAETNWIGQHCFSILILLPFPYFRPMESMVLLMQ
jgi:hypothetical protein